MATARSSNQAALDRLVADMRVLDADGIERAAWAWDRHERGHLNEYHEAERAALKAIEDADIAPAWEELRRTLFGLTETPGALVHWKAEHGDKGHRAERAAFGAALGLFAREHISRAQYVSLVQPMAEVLPWLLPETRPLPHR
jgi:hypothetical protein